MLKKIIGKSLKIIDFVCWTDYYVKLQNHYLGFHDPMYQFKKSEIAFVHVPKTGGTSFHKLLYQDEVFRFINFIQKTGETSPHKSPYQGELSRFINLNMHRPVSQFCEPSEYSYITLIRDPVKRVWSYYQMILRSPPGSPYKRFSDNGIECFLKHCWEVQNMACRYYSGEVKKKPDSETLKKALNNLVNFTCIIDFDNFEKEVAEFLKKYNVIGVSIPNERKSSYARYNQSDYNLICQYNKLDMELFAKWREQSKSNYSDPL